MKFKQAFSFMANDPKWFKKLLGMAWTLFIPVIGIFIFNGYFAKVTKNVIEGDDDVLVPELDFSTDLTRGWKLFLLQLIYMVPVLIFALIMTILNLILESIDRNVIYTLTTISMVCFVLLMVLLGVLITLILPIAIANFIAKDDFKAGLNFKEIFGMLKKSFSSWLLVFCGNFLTQSMIILGVVNPLAMVVLSIYAGLAYHHLIGQAYNMSNTPKLAEAEL